MLADPEADDDTIEIELTAEEMRGLSRAADEAQRPKYVPRSLKRRFRLWPLALGVPVIGIAAALMWHPKDHAAQRPAPLAVASITPPAASEPALPAQPPESPVRVKNPFDPSEVFEFPAGTTRAEARQKISQVLLQRAVDRGSLVRRMRPLRRRRAKNADDQS